jgi:hypothetical protein
MIFPVALTLEASSPVAVRQDTLEVESDMLEQTARVANEFGNAPRPIFCPVQDNVPTSPRFQVFKFYIHTESAAIFSGSAPSK